MQKNKIAIAKKTLKFLDKHSFNKINLRNILGKEKKININNKKDLLININRYFYFLLKENLYNLDK